MKRTRVGLSFAYFWEVKTVIVVSFQNRPINSHNERSWRESFIDMAILRPTLRPIKTQ